MNDSQVGDTDLGLLNSIDETKIAQKLIETSNNSFPLPLSACWLIYFLIIKWNFCSSKSWHLPQAITFFENFNDLKLINSTISDYFKKKKKKKN